MSILIIFNVLSKYFKIHCAESGKWVEFDPPEDHVEEVVAGNKKQQKIIDAQRKARMDKANEMAGRFKQKIDKEDRGAKNRIDESKKSGAAEDHVNRSKSKSTNSASSNTASNASPNPTPNPSAPKQKMTSQSEAMRKRLQKRLAEKKQKLAMEATREVPAETAKPSTKGKVNVKGKGPANSTKDNKDNKNNKDNTNLKEKTDAVYKASDELDAKKQELERTNANIEKIRRLMNKQ